MSSKQFCKIKKLNKVCSRENIKRKTTQLHSKQFRQNQKICLFEENMIVKFPKKMFQKRFLQSINQRQRRELSQELNSSL